MSKRTGEATQVKGERQERTVARNYGSTKLVHSATKDMGGRKPHHNDIGCRFVIAATDLRKSHAPHNVIVVNASQIPCKERPPLAGGLVDSIVDVLTNRCKIKDGALGAWERRFLKRLGFRIPPGFGNDFGHFVELLLMSCLLIVGGSLFRHGSGQFCSGSTIRAVRQEGMMAAITISSTECHVAWGKYLRRIYTELYRAADETVTRSWLEFV